MIDPGVRGEAVRQVVRCQLRDRAVVAGREGRGGGCGGARGEVARWVGVGRWVVADDGEREGGDGEGDGVGGGG